MAGRGLYLGVFATGIGGFCAIILFLFCTPNFETLFALTTPQPFVEIYALALGKGPSTFMTIIAAIGYSLVSHLFSLRPRVRDAYIPYHLSDW